MIIKKLITISRPVMAILSAFTVMVGSLLTSPDHTLDITAFFAAISEALLVAAVFQLNDVFDLKRDKLAETYKPVATGELSTVAVIISVTILTGISLFLAWLIGPVSLVFLVVQALIGLLLYSFIKNWNGFAGNLITAILFASTIGYGALQYGISEIAYIMMGIICMFILGREIIKDVVDIVPDSRIGLKTLPTTIGIKASVITGYFVTFTGLIGLNYLSFEHGPVLILMTLFASFLTIKAFIIAYRGNTTEIFIKSLKWTAASMIIGTICLAIISMS